MMSELKLLNKCKCASERSIPWMKQWKLLVAVEYVRLYVILVAIYCYLER